MKRKFQSALALVALAVMVAGCGTGGNSAPSAADQSQAASDKLQSKIYQSKHNIEFRNYNLRQRIADDPSVILWCTFFPPGVSQVTNGSVGGAITVPIAGKLTSSNKRPYQGNQYSYSDASAVGISGESPGPDHMFGSSSEYSYGFDPTLSTYYQFSNLASFCTTEPTVWQVKATEIVVNTQSTLANLSNAASAAIKAGDPKKALELLKQADTAAAAVPK